MMLYATINGFYDWPELRSILQQQAAFQDALQQIQPEIKAYSDERAGLYTQTLDGGSEASIALWKEAVQKEPRFANPKEFPWTLPSSLSGFIAMTLNIKGPNYTFIGQHFAFFEALDQALWDLNSQLIECAVVVSYSGQIGENGGMSLLVLSVASESPETENQNVLNFVQEEENHPKENALLRYLFKDYANKSRAAKFMENGSNIFLISVHQNKIGLDRIFEKDTIT